MLSDSEEDSPREFYYLDETSDKNASFFSKEESAKHPRLANKNTSCQTFCSIKMPYNKLLINLACSVCTKKYQTSVFCTNLVLRARSVQKDLGLIFPCTDLALG